MPDLVISKNLTFKFADDQWNAIESAILAGRKIEAIKLVRRSVPQTGLAEAKACVDKLEGDLRERQPERFAANGGADSGVNWRGLIIVFLFLALIGYVILKMLHK